MYNDNEVSRGLPSTRRIYTLTRIIPILINDAYTRFFFFFLHKSFIIPPISTFIDRNSIFASPIRLQLSQIPMHFLIYSNVLNIL